MTPPVRIAVVGAGGHAKVVVATIEAAGGEIVRVLDDNAALHGTRILGHRVEGPIADDAIPAGTAVIVAIGSNRLRRVVADRLQRVTFATVVHPSAVVHDSARIGPGSVVMAGVVIQPGTEIARHVIVNTSASIDHDCSLGDFVHVGPGVRLAGHVRLEEGALAGIGSCAIPLSRVGPWATIGAGAVVRGEIPGEATAVGVPARVIGSKR